MIKGKVLSPVFEGFAIHPGVSRFRGRALFACLCGALILAGLASCGGAGKPSGPLNVILISIDTLRSDHLGCYGYSRTTSPVIDSLAQAGTLFEEMEACSPWTLPSHTSMLTGLYPSFHMVQDDGVKLAPGIPTLAERLHEDGYYTFGVVSHIYVSSQFGLDRGFDIFDDSMIEGGKTNPIAGQVVDRALQILDEAPADRPYFAFIHFFDPHWDYAAPSPFDRRFADPGYRGPINGTLRSMMPYRNMANDMAPADLQRAIDLYDGEIAYVDHQIGRLLGELRQQGRLENTVIVLTGDHGEEFREHRSMGHGVTLFQEVLRVPLIIAGHPAFPARARRSDLVSTVDVAPTILSMVEAPAIDDVQGVSLAGRRADDDRIIYASTIRFGNEIRMARRGQQKAIYYLHGDHWQFFDLVRDPAETQTERGDPTGGELFSSLMQFVSVADEGWHLQVITLRERGLRLRGRLRTTGRFVNPRRYFSGNTLGTSRVEFSRFELSPDRKELSFEAEIDFMMGQVTFNTEPQDAPVTFMLDVQNDAGTAGTFLGRGIPVENGRPIRLTANDPNLAGAPAGLLKAPPGCYIRSVIPSAGAGESVTLSPGAIERLRSLGY